MVKTKIILISIVFLMIFSACSNYNTYLKYDEYCHDINNIIKEKNFNVATLTNNKILLKDVEFKVIEEIPFEENKRLKLSSIRKEENRIFYAISGSVDDTYGILIVNDGCDEMMDGIHKLERVGGNSYYYDTRG